MLHIFDQLFEVNFYESNNSQSQCQCLIWIQQNGSLLIVNCQPYTIHFNWRLCCSIIELNNWRGWFKAHWITLLIPDNLHILFLIPLMKLSRCFSRKSKKNFEIMNKYQYILVHLFNYTKYICLIIWYIVICTLIIKITGCIIYG